MTDTAQSQTRDTDEPPVALRVVQLLGVCFLVFLGGGLAATYNVAPMPFILTALSNSKELWDEMTRTRWEILSARIHPGEGLVTYDPARSAPGLTLVQGLMPGGAQIRLYAEDGTILHRWPLDFFKIWPNPTHIIPAAGIPKTKWNYHVQGMHAYPDGSIVANFSGKGAARLDKCGNVIWTLDRMTHHAITAMDDGTLLFPAYKPVTQVDADLIPSWMSREQLIASVSGALHDYENTILFVNPDDGTVIREFSLLRSLYNAGLEGAFFDSATYKPSDPTHLNDIEVVTPALAAKIDGVAAGDLLVSVRNMNMLAILDRNTGKLLWHKRGPWVHQHDPDIEPDGKIEIFNNRSPLSLHHGSGSQILSYDPATGAVEVLQPASKAAHFASLIMGTSQRLANGNHLIAESTFGRTFEVTPDGKIVWDLLIPYDADHSSFLEAVDRVPTDYFNVTDWSCP